MSVFDVPTMPCFFFMLGKTASSIAAQAASSLQDHVPASRLHQFRYICAMDESSYADLEKQFRNHNVRKCDEADYYNQLNAEVATGMIDRARSAMMAHSAELLDQGISMNSMAVYYVTQAGEVDANTLFAIEAAVHQYVKATGCTYRNALCMLASAQFSDFAMQGNWLSEINANGVPQVKSGFQNFEKILLLTPKDDIGMESEAVRRKMEDAFPIALLMAHNSNYVDSKTQVYTIAYDKLNATSADLRLLRDHLASEELENWFARSNGTDPWVLLSTRSLPLIQSNDPLFDALEKSAKAEAPTIADLALNADLQDAGFSAMETVLQFDQKNSRAMCNQEDWKSRWMHELLEAVQNTHQPDRLRNFLMDTQSAVSIKHSAYNIFKKNKDTDFSTEELQKRLNRVILPTKTLRDKLAGSAHYNLRCLQAYCSAYERFCVERMIWERAKCITGAIEEVCATIDKWIKIRRSALSKHLITDAALIQNLSTLCGPYENVLRHAYRQMDIAADLLGFANLAPGLCQEKNNTWEELYVTYRDQVQPANDFTSTFIAGNTNQQLFNNLSNALDRESRLLTGWPTAAAMPHPSPIYMMRNDLALRVQGAGSLSCREIPGDLVERFAVFPVLTRTANPANNPGLDGLLTMGIFNTNALVVNPIQPVNIPPDDDGAAPPAQKMTNPWNINIVFIGGQYYLTWDYKDNANSCTISLNGEEIEQDYSFSEYCNNNRSLPLQPSMLGKGSYVQVLITNGSQQQQYDVRLVRNIIPINLDADGGRPITVDKSLMLYRYRFLSTLNYGDQATLRLEKRNGVCYEYDIVGTSDQWIRLWCTDDLPDLYLIQ